MGFHTDQMGGGKYHNGNSMYNPDWNNGKAIHYLMVLKKQMVKP
jgi:hypothetical protein